MFAHAEAHEAPKSTGSGRNVSVLFVSTSDITSKTVMSSPPDRYLPVPSALENVTNCCALAFSINPKTNKPTTAIICIIKWCEAE